MNLVVEVRTSRNRRGGLNRFAMFREIFQKILKRAFLFEGWIL